MEITRSHMVPDFAGSDTRLSQIPDGLNLHPNRLDLPFSSAYPGHLPISRNPSTLTKINRVPEESPATLYSPKFRSSSKMRYYVVAVASESESFSPSDEKIAFEEYFKNNIRQSVPFANYRAEDKDTVDAHSAGCSSPAESSESAGDTTWSPAGGSNFVKQMKPPTRVIARHRCILPSVVPSLPSSVKSPQFSPSSQFPMSRFAECSDKNYTSPDFQTQACMDFPRNRLSNEVNEQPLNLTMPRWKNPQVSTEDLDDNQELSPTRRIGSHVDEKRVPSNLVSLTDTDSRVVSRPCISISTDQGIKLSTNHTDKGFHVHDNDLSVENAQFIENKCSSKTDQNRSLIKKGSVGRAKPSKSPKERFKLKNNAKARIPDSKNKSDLLTARKRTTKSHKCPHCSKSFPLPWKLKIHLRVHTGEKPFQCHVCGKRFSVRCNLRDHIQLHTGDRRWKCDLCEAKFSWPSQLRAHERVHSGERPYKCQYCPMTFAWSSSKTHHERVHRGEKKFQCPDCDMRFQRKSALANHSRVHTGLKPYNCKFCIRVFSHRTTLKQHERLHTGEKPYICNICTNKFQSLRTFRKHKELMHNSNYPYICPICLINFQTLPDYTEHNRILHKISGKRQPNLSKLKTKGSVDTLQDAKKVKDSSDDETKQGTSINEDAADSATKNKSQQLKRRVPNESLYSQLLTPESPNTSLDPKQPFQSSKKAKRIFSPKKRLLRYNETQNLERTQQTFHEQINAKSDVYNASESSSSTDNDDSCLDGSIQHSPHSDVHASITTTAFPSSESLGEVNKERISREKDSQQDNSVLDLSENPNDRMDRHKLIKPQKDNSQYSRHERMGGYAQRSSKIPEWLTTSDFRNRYSFQNLKVIDDCYCSILDGKCSHCKHQSKAQISEQTLNHNEMYTGDVIYSSEVATKPSDLSDPKRTSVLSDKCSKLKHLLIRPRLQTDQTRFNDVGKYPRLVDGSSTHSAAKKSNPVKIHVPRYSSTSSMGEIISSSLNQGWHSLYEYLLTRGNANFDTDRNMILDGECGSKTTAVIMASHNQDNTIKNTLPPRNMKSAPDSTHSIICPACSEAFSSLSVLQAHFVTFHILPSIDVLNQASHAMEMP